MRSNSYFKRFSAVFKCRNCGRNTRDTTGDNGDVELCADCYDGCSYENGANDSSDPAEAAEYRKRADECFKRAVSKGGSIKGY